MPSDSTSQTWGRRGFLRLGAAATALAGLTAYRTASAHLLPGSDITSSLYDNALNAKGGHKAVFQTPHVDASVLVGGQLIHLVLGQITNWLNGYQFSYKLLHVVAALYGSANVLTYNDTLWQKYRFGEVYKVIDPSTGKPATRNLFWPSFNGATAGTNPDDLKSVWQDVGIEVLQRRGVLFMT